MADKKRKISYYYLYLYVNNENNYKMLYFLVGLVIRFSVSSFFVVVFCFVCLQLGIWKLDAMVVQSKCHFIW